MFPRKRLAADPYGLHPVRDVGHRSHFDLASQGEILLGDAGFAGGETDRSPGEFAGLSGEPGSHGLHLRRDLGLESGECADGGRARFAGHVVEREPQAGATLARDFPHSSELFHGMGVGTPVQNEESGDEGSADSRAGQGESVRRVTPSVRSSIRNWR